MRFTPPPPSAPPAARGTLNGVEPGAELLRRVDAWTERVLTLHARGPVADIAREHLASGGRQFRCRLVLAATSALGGDAEQAVPFAAACELMHNASLVHDDLQDGDRVRRGRPTVWARHGAAQAINAGDLLLMLPFCALHAPGTLDGERSWALTRALGRRAAHTVSGQALEQWLQEQASPGWADYLEVCAGKTGQFFALPVEGAALVSGLSAERAHALGEATLALGQLFQLRDDVVDLYGDKGRGERGNDIREGKISALVVAHLERAPREREATLAALRTSRDQTGDDVVARLARRFTSSGALRDVVARGRALLATLRDDPAWSGAAPLRHALVSLARGWLTEMAVCEAAASEAAVAAAPPLASELMEHRSVE